jgi:prevent-host-death family protein
MQVPTFEAKNRLSALLAEVARGAEVARRGVPVAKLVPAMPGFDREPARRAAAGLREASRGTALGRLRIKDPVDEGRS